MSPPVTESTVEQAALDWLVDLGHEIVLSSYAVLRAFHVSAIAVIDIIDANIHQSRSLAAFRDTLLPKLLSGEIMTLSSFPNHP